MEKLFMSLLVEKNDDIFIDKIKEFPEVLDVSIEGLNLILASKDSVKRIKAIADIDSRHLCKQFVNGITLAQCSTVSINMDILELLGNYAPMSFCIPDKDGTTPAFLAIDNPKTLEFIAAIAPESFKTRLNSGETLAYYAVQQNCTKSVSIISKVAPETFEEKCENQTPAFYCAMKGYIESLKIIADAAPQTLTIPCMQGSVPAHIAAQENQLEALKLIHKYKPDSLKLTTDKGLTPAYVATIKDSIECLQFINDVFPQTLSLEANDGNSIEEIAIKTGSVNSLKFITGKEIDYHNLYQKVDYSNRDLSNSYYFQQNFDDINFTGANLQNAKFEQTSLNNTNFSHANLSSSLIIGHLKNTQGLETATLINTILYGYIPFSDLDLRHQNYTGTYFHRATFINCDLSNVSFKNAYLAESKFINCKLDNATFEYAVLWCAEFRGCSLIDTDFSESTISNFNGIGNKIDSDQITDLLDSFGLEDADIRDDELLKLLLNKKGVKGLIQRIFGGSYGKSTTKWKRNKNKKREWQEYYLVDDQNTIKHRYSNSADFVSFRERCECGSMWNIISQSFATDCIYISVSCPVCGKGYVFKKFK